MSWINLSSISQLNESFLNSENKPQLYFKHSTRCIISKMALKEFERSGVLNRLNADFYLLDLLNYREISNEITKLSNLEHQSPQAILIKNKSVIYVASHSAIDGGKLESILEELQ